MSSFICLLGPILKETVFFLLTFCVEVCGKLPLEGVCTWDQKVNKAFLCCSGLPG